MVAEKRQLRVTGKYTEKEWMITETSWSVRETKEKRRVPFDRWHQNNALLRKREYAEFIRPFTVARRSTTDLRC